MIFQNCGNIFCPPVVLQNMFRDNAQCSSLSCFRMWWRGSQTGNFSSFNFHSCFSITAAPPFFCIICFSLIWSLAPLLLCEVSRWWRVDPPTGRSRLYPHSYHPAFTSTESTRQVPKIEKEKFCLTRFSLERKRQLKNIGNGTRLSSLWSTLTIGRFPRPRQI